MIMSTALVNRMPFRRGTGKIENISYILDNRWSGSPKIAANDAEEDSRDNFRLPRQFPFDDDGIRRENASAKQKKKPQSIEGIVRGEDIQVLSNLLKTLLPYGTTLDSVIIDAAKKEIKTLQEGSKQQPLPSQAASFFSYFGHTPYSFTKLPLHIAAYSVSTYQSFAKSFKSLFAGYVAPKYTNPNYTPRVKHRMRKRKSYKERVLSHLDYSAIAPTFDKPYSKISALVPIESVHTEPRSQAYSLQTKPNNRENKSSYAILPKQQVLAVPYAPYAQSVNTKQYASLERADILNHHGQPLPTSMPYVAHRHYRRNSNQTMMNPINPLMRQAYGNLSMPASNDNPYNSNQLSLAAPTRTNYDPRIRSHQLSPFEGYGSNHGSKARTQIRNETINTSLGVKPIIRDGTTLEGIVSVFEEYAVSSEDLQNKLYLIKATNPETGKVEERSIPYGSILAIIDRKLRQGNVTPEYKIKAYTENGQKNYDLLLDGVLEFNSQVVNVLRPQNEHKLGYLIFQNHEEPKKGTASVVTRIPKLGDVLSAAVIEQGVYRGNYSKNQSGHG
jgi:hypothetical protein